MLFGISVYLYQNAELGKRPENSYLDNEKNYGERIFTTGNR